MDIVIIVLALPTLAWDTNTLANLGMISTTDRVLHHPDGAKYVGEFGEGQGTLTHGGTKYTWEFNDGKIDGQGTLIYSTEPNTLANGKVVTKMEKVLNIILMEASQQGVYKDDVFQYAKKVEP